MYCIIENKKKHTSLLFYLMKVSQQIKVIIINMYLENLKYIYINY